MSIVFLHVPKTAGQTVHNELVRIVGGQRHVSPVRVNGDHINGKKMPAGYRLYSGHIDWEELGELHSRFAFTILRDPRERLASFYFFMRERGLALSKKELMDPANFGKRNAALLTPDDYFFAGEGPWQDFMLDHYDNFYCHYFATRKIRGRKTVLDLPQKDLIGKARAHLSELDAVYHTDALMVLEEDIFDVFGETINVVSNYFNTGIIELGQSRWNALNARFESDRSRQMIANLVEKDLVLFEQIQRL